MSNPRPSEEQIVNAIYQFAAEQIKSGKSGPQVRAMLIDKGLDSESALTIVSNLGRMRTDAFYSAGKRNMIFGALWCAGGTIVSIATYNMAATNGGTYVVAWGAILFGAIQFFRGLNQIDGN